MNEYDIKETLDFELALAELVLEDERWQYKFRELRFTTNKKSRVDRQGRLYISLPLYEDSRDYKALRIDIRHLFADLHCGFASRNNFVWHRIAKKLNAIQEITAEDLAECELCNTLTPLTKSKRCPKCKKIEEAVLADPEGARKILAQFDIARKVLNMKGESNDSKERIS